VTTAVVLGLVIGALIGLVGGGGSILTVPALVYGVGMPLSRAIPTSLIVVGVSALFAAAPRVPRREIRWRIAAVFGGAGVAAAFGGAAVNRLLPARVVLLGFVALMLVAAWRMLRSTDEEQGGDCALPEGGVNWRSCLPKAVGSGVVVGFLTGLFGVGGGFVIVPALALLLGLPMAVAVGTSLVIISVNSAAGFLAHLGGASIEVGVTVAFTAATVVTAVLAGRFAGRVSGDRLRTGFAVLVVGVALFVGVQALVNPGAAG
jgi:uncharacterized membrane protein YfcA